MQYFIEWSRTNDAVWIHAADGSTVGRFGKMGVDLHNSVTEQLSGAPECRLCTHKSVTREDWEIFKSKAKEWWDIDVPDEAFAQRYFSEPVLKK